MAKQKNRAARKLKRERAARAQSRGLPQAKRESETLDTSARTIPSRRSKAARRDGSNQKRGTALKVLVGVAVALLLVYFASRSRKENLLDAKSNGAQLATSRDEVSNPPGDPTDVAIPEPKSAVEADALESSTPVESGALVESPSSSEKELIDEVTEESPSPIATSPRTASPAPTAQKSPFRNVAQPKVEQPKVEQPKVEQPKVEQPTAPVAPTIPLPVAPSSPTSPGSADTSAQDGLSPRSISP